MEEYNPNPAGSEANKDGANANQGGDNSQAQGNQNQNQGGNQNPNQGAGNGQPPAGDVDYKKKFGESTTENQKYRDALKANGIDPNTLKPIAGNQGVDPNDYNNDGAGDTFFTDEELAQTFPSYAAMTQQEKAVLKQVGSFPKMARMVAEMHDKLTFNEQLEVIKADPTNKIIIDNEKEFKAFAYKDENLKLPLEVLKNAFVGMKLQSANNQNQGQNNQPPAPQGMEDGSAGQGQGSDTASEMTAEQARDLRTKEPRKYNALVRTGKLKIV